MGWDDELKKIFFKARAPRAGAAQSLGSDRIESDLNDIRRSTCIKLRIAARRPLSSLPTWKPRSFVSPSPRASLPIGLSFSFSSCFVLN